MTPVLPFAETELAVIKADAARSRAGKKSAGRLEDELVSSLVHLKALLEQADRFGPSEPISLAYRTRRSWFMKNYGSIRSMMRTHAVPEPKEVIATWSLESTAADRIYTFIAPADIYEPSTGWKSGMERLIREARRISKAVKT